MQNDRINLCLSYWRGSPGESELMYWLKCDCSRYHALEILLISSPFSIMVSYNFLLRNTISLILIVRSSSLDRELVSIMLGLMQTGGTTRWSTIKSLMSVVPPIFTKMNCYFGIFSNIFLASYGFSSNIKSSFFLSELSINPLLILFSTNSLFLNRRTSTKRCVWLLFCHIL